MSETLTIPGYTIESKLGQGGMASVYLAIQESFGRAVALKVMSPELSSDPSFATRFMREARIVAVLTHASIVPVFEVGEYDSVYYLSMEYLPAGDLKTRIETHQGNLALAIDVCTAVCSALDFAHRKGFVHRDIKPENIMFREDGTPVVTDFGIARALDSGNSLTRVGMMVGTPNYMSPEQVKGQELDGRSDLYSLGVVFYEILSGMVPFMAETPVSVAWKHVNDHLPPLPREFAAYQEFFERLTAKNRESRFATGTDVLRALHSVTPPPSSIDSTLVRPPRLTTPPAFTPPPVSVAPPPRTGSPGPSRPAADAANRGVSGSPPPKMVPRPTAPPSKKEPVEAPPVRARPVVPPVATAPTAPAAAIRAASPALNPTVEAVPLDTAARDAPASSLAGEDDPGTHTVFRPAARSGLGWIAAGALTAFVTVVSAMMLMNHSKPTRTGAAQTSSSSAVIVRPKVKTAAVTGRIRPAPEPLPPARPAPAADPAPLAATDAAASSAAESSAPESSTAESSESMSSSPPAVAFAPPAPTSAFPAAPTRQQALEPAPRAPDPPSRPARPPDPRDIRIRKLEEAQAAAKLTEKLTGARRAMVSGQIWTPAGRSAAYLYRQALDQKPGLPEAVAGVRLLAPILVDEAERYELAGDIANAAAVILQIEMLQAKNSKLEALHEKLAQLMKQPVKLDAAQKSHLEHVAEYVERARTRLNTAPMDARCVADAPALYDMAVAEWRDAPGLPSLQAQFIAAYGVAVKTEQARKDSRAAQKVLETARQRRWYSREIFEHASASATSAPPMPVRPAVAPLPGAVTKRAGET